MATATVNTGSIQIFWEPLGSGLVTRFSENKRLHDQQLRRSGNTDVSYEPLTLRHAGETRSALKGHSLGVHKFVDLDQDNPRFLELIITPPDKKTADRRSYSVFCSSRRVLEIARPIIDGIGRDQSYDLILNAQYIVDRTLSEGACSSEKPIIPIGLFFLPHGEDDRAKIQFLGETYTTPTRALRRFRFYPPLTEPSSLTNGEDVRPDENLEKTGLLPPPPPFEPKKILKPSLDRRAETANLYDAVDSRVKSLSIENCNTLENVYNNFLRQMKTGTERKSPKMRITNCTLSDFCLQMKDPKNAIANEAKRKDAFLNLKENQKLKVRTFTQELSDFVLIMENLVEDGYGKLNLATFLATILANEIVTDRFIEQELKWKEELSQKQPQPLKGNLPKQQLADREMASEDPTALTLPKPTEQPLKSISRWIAQNPDYAAYIITAHFAAIMAIIYYVIFNVESET